MFTEKTMIRLSELSQKYPVRITVKPKASETKEGDQYTVAAYVWQAVIAGNFITLEIRPDVVQYNVLLDKWIDYVELVAQTLV